MEEFRVKGSDSVVGEVFGGCHVLECAASTSLFMCSFRGMYRQHFHCVFVCNKLLSNSSIKASFRS